MNEFAVIVDPAKKRDFTAIMIVKQTPEVREGARSLSAPDRVVNFMDIVHIDKFNNITYPKMVEVVAARCGHREIANNHDLLVDQTGIGEAVIDMMREKYLNPIPILSTGGDNVTQVFAEMGSVFGNVPGKLQGAKMVKELHVPKADMIAAGMLLMQQGRVRVAGGLAWERDFRDQLLAFKGTFNEGGRVKSAEAETEKDHDDLVVCFLMGAWWLTRGGEQLVPDQALPLGKLATEDWEPYDYM